MPPSSGDTSCHADRGCRLAFLSLTSNNQITFLDRTKIGGLVEKPVNRQPKYCRDHGLYYEVGNGMIIMNLVSQDLCPLRPVRGWGLYSVLC